MKVTKIPWISTADAMPEPTPYNFDGGTRGPDYLVRYVIHGFTIYSIANRVVSKFYGKRVTDWLLHPGGAIEDRKVTHWLKIEDPPMAVDGDSKKALANARTRRQAVNRKP